MIPQLETDRLILRAWRAEDFEPLAQFMADPEVTRWLNGEPQSRTDAWRGMAAMVGHWALRGYGFWAVERKEDHAFIGRVGVWYPEGWPGMEVGWTLGRPYWGKGYATEAARVSMDYGFITQSVAKLISVIHVGNQPSKAVAQRIGESFARRQEITWGGKTFPVEIWEITRERWLAQRSHPHG